MPTGRFALPRFTVALVVACLAGFPATARAETAKDRKAIAALGRAAALAQRDGQVPIEGDARRELALLLDAAGKPAEAVAAAERALELARQTADAGRTARAELALGRILSISDRGQARIHLQAALAGFESLGQERDQAIALAFLVRVVGDLEQQMAYAERGLDLARRAGDRETEARILQHLGNRKTQQGDLKDAYADFEAVLALLGNDRRSDVVAATYWSLGRLYRMHGDHDRALSHYRKALDHHRRQGDRRRMAITLNSLGVLMQDMSRQRDAIRHYQRSADMAREAGAEGLGLVPRLNIASIRMKLGEHQRAAEVLRALVGAKSLDEHAQAIAQVRLAQAELGLGLHEQALAGLQAALHGPRRADLEVKVDALLVRSRVHAALGDREAALADLAEALAFVEDKRAQLVASDALKHAFSYGQTLAAATVDLLSALGRDVEALETAERARARAFLDLLASRQDGGAGPADSPEAGRPATFAEIAAAAGRLGSTVVSYFVTDDATIAWIVPPDGRLRSVRIAVGRDALSDLVARARPGRDAARTTSPKEVWRRLHEVLVAPLRPWLPSAKGARLTIVPHGPLVLLPFAALRSPDGRYLVEDYAIHYAPAMGFFGHVDTTRPAGHVTGTLIVADPSPMPADPAGYSLPSLPAARAEAEAVAAVRGAGSVILTGDAATESRFLQEARGASVVHLATHGLAWYDEPQESFLAFAKGGDADGRLTAGEVYRLRLSADLVVLSGCRTAVGRLSADGILGLTRAFLSAGASSVVATTWDVADGPTTDLMRAFYARLGAGGTKDDALRSAQLQTLARLRAGRVMVPGPLGSVAVREDPWLWAAFVLVGEP